jgi:predicted TIM-barrel fold metal-dependent hydrolase
VWRVAQIWSWAKKLGVLNRLLWGSDYPYVPFQTGQEQFGKVPVYSERHEIEPIVTKEDLDSFFGGAAARMLGLVREEVAVGGRGAACP